MAGRGRPRKTRTTTVSKAVTETTANNETTQRTTAMEAEEQEPIKRRKKRRLVTVPFKPLRCPRCSSLALKTVSTNPVEGKNLVYRNHTCHQCDTTFRSESPAV